MWYPKTEWLYFYTDGLACDAQGYAGTGVYAVTFEIAEPIDGKMASNFEVEVRSILLALQRLGQEPTSKAALFVDYQVAILMPFETSSTVSRTVGMSLPSLL